jgi:hypothetical protein
MDSETDLEILETCFNVSIKMLLSLAAAYAALQNPNDMLAVFSLNAIPHLNYGDKPVNSRVDACENLTHKMFDS